MRRQYQWVKEMQKEVEIPQVVCDHKKLAYEQIKKQECENNKQSTITRHSQRKWIPHNVVACCIIVIVICSAITVGAAAISYWNKNFLKEHDASLELQEKLIEQGATVVLDTQDTSKGITIRAVQAIMDDTFAYILFEITGDDKITLENERFHLNISIGGGKPVGHSSGIKSKLGENGETLYEVFLWDLDAKGYHGKEIKCEFSEDVPVSYISENGWIVETVNEWNLSWKMPDSQYQRDYHINQQILNHNVNITDVQLSPISVTVYYDEWPVPNSIINPNADPEECTQHTHELPMYLYGFSLKDGSMLLLEDINGQGGGRRPDNNEHGNYSLPVSFQKIIDIDTIDGLLFGRITKNHQKKRNPSKDELWEVKLNR